MKKDLFLVSKFFYNEIDFESKSLDSTVHGFMSKFYNDNMVSISGDGFTKRIVFGGMKRAELIKIYGIGESDWKHVWEIHDTIKWCANVQDILNIELLLHYYNTHDVMYLKFLAIKLFTAKYYKAFPKYTDEAKMKALINGLSNKFFIKKLGSLDKALDKTLETYLRTYEDRFKEETDDNIIYLVNGLATRVNALVKYIRIRFYEFNGTVYEDVEVLDRDNMRITTNDTARYDAVINQTINTESVNRVDVISFKQAEGLHADKKIFDNMYKNNFKSVRTLISTLVNNFVKDNPKVSTNEAQNKLIEYILSNRTNSSDVDKLLDNCFEDVSLDKGKKDTMKKILKKYVAIRIFRTFLKQSA